MAGTRARGTRGLAIGALGGAAGAYLFDPDSGSRRRALARDRIAALVRGGYRSAADTAQTAATAARDKATGTAAAARSAAAEQSAPNDQTLAERVKSEIFRDPDAPKDSVNVNAEVGIVYLRGQVESTELITELVDATRAVEGVRAVENLLHLPGEEAMHKQETEPETRRRVTGARSS